MPHGFGVGSVRPRRLSRPETPAALREFAHGASLRGADGRLARGTPLLAATGKPPQVPQGMRLPLRHTRERNFLRSMRTQCSASSARHSSGTTLPGSSSTQRAVFPLLRAPSRRSSRPTSPGRVHRSASSRTRSRYSAVNWRRIGLATISGSGTGRSWPPSAPRAAAPACIPVPPGSVSDLIALHLPALHIFHRAPMSRTSWQRRGRSLDFHPLGDCTEDAHKLIVFAQDGWVRGECRPSRLQPRRAECQCSAVPASSRTSSQAASRADLPRPASPPRGSAASPSLPNTAAHPNLSRESRSEDKRVK